MLKLRRLLGWFRSFQAKVALALISAIVIAAFLGEFFIYQYALKSQFNQLQERLKVIAQTAALSVDGDVLKRVPLNKKGVDSPEFKEILRVLRRIKKVNPSIAYIYTMSAGDKDNIFRFVVDEDYDDTKNIASGNSSYPGDKYDASSFPQMKYAFYGPVADIVPGQDAWGKFLSGYAPVVDANGKAVAILGIDMLANDVYKNQTDVHKRALLVFSLSLLLAFILAIVFSRGVTAPLKKVVEGTRKISFDDLDHQVPVKGSDEISELARSFNKMTHRLKGARRKLNSYFYNVLQSFVRIFEARDPYMRGHSERVADYSVAIAQKMGLPGQLVEFLREAALLHDIGKLGIQEELLNKSGPLTKDEWETIKTHPVIGEDILRPLLSNEILAIVRGHHERFDGKGYPDKLSGNQISTFLAIVAVADSYDAMTSSRPYRPAMSKEEAIKELLKNEGGQFSEEVVEIFIKVLNKK